MSNISVEQISRKEYRIYLHENEKKDSIDIGYIFVSGRRITDIKIDQEYRNQGYGKKALRKLINSESMAGFDKIKTTPVLSPEAEMLFESLGFEVDREPIKGSPKYILCR